MKINIAYIIPSLDVGGSEQKVIDLARNLDKTKFNPIIITITKLGKLEPIAKSLGINVICVNKTSKFDFFVIKRIASVLKNGNVDIVHVFTSTGKLWGRLGAIKAKTKHIISTEESLFRNKFIDRFLEKRLIKKTSLIITNSFASKESAINATRISSNKYMVIHNGVNLKPFREAKFLNLLNKKSDEQIIMCVARFDYRKSINTLIDAFNSLDSKDNIKLVLVGDGPLKDDLQEQVNRLQINDKVLFLGFRNDVASLLKEADVFVLPSIEEGFGNVIIEAMAANVCVVASNVGGIPEIIENNINGIMFKKGMVADLSDSLFRVLNDKELREKLINNANQMIDKFSDVKMISKHEEIYLKLMKGGN